MSSSLIKTVSNKNPQIKSSYSVESGAGDGIIGVRTNLVYSQMARISRVSNKTAELDLLIKALDDSSIKVTIKGRTIKRDPLYVFMPSKDLKLCFGKRVDKLPRYAIIKID